MRQEEKASVLDGGINKAIRLFGEGRLSQAKEISLNIRSDDPTYPKALSMLGVIASEMGEFDQAVELISQAIEVKPDYAEAHSNLGNLLRNQGRFPEAEERYLRALELKPGFTDFINNLAITQTELERPEDSVASCRQAIAINPDMAEAHNTLGGALTALGRLDEAVSSYRKAIAIKPDYAETHSNLGSILNQMGQLEEGIHSLKKAITLKPDFADAHYNLGNALRELGQPDEAVDSYNKAITIKPDFARAYNNLGNVFKEMGRLGEAVASYQKALTNKPDYAEAHFNLGNALKEQGKIEEAITNLQKALAIRPEYSEAQYILGGIYEGLGQAEKAIHFFKKAGINNSEEKILLHLYKTEKFEEFNERLQVISKKKPASALISSLSVHASVNLDQPENYNFCGNPLDFVYQNKFECLFENDEKLLQSLLRDIRSDKIGSRTQSLLKFGKQSSGNLFNNPELSFACLPDLILTEVEKYRALFQGEECLLISQWPKKTRLLGWYVKMQSGGYLNTHIHESGWVSGAIYLSIPENLSQDEGSFEISLHGNNYPRMHRNFPTKTLPVKTGNIVIFPSSAFHRTIPFSSDEERICIAFDIMPQEDL